ncbi:MAG: nitroreductase [Rhodospirillales bacterium]|nr:nitroreductase [Rhodospirillales bacterium]
MRNDATAADAPGVLDVIMARRSVPVQRLGPPGPTPDEIRRMVAAAVTAPDHGALRPWRFRVIDSDTRLRLADLFVAARTGGAPDAPAAVVDKERDKALAGPVLMAVTAPINHGHPKVPASEQYVSVGMAVQNLLLAARSLGYAGILLSGERVRDPAVRAVLAVADDAELIGFITIGTPDGDLPPKRRPNPDDHLAFGP